MKFSQLLTKTLREAPADEQAINAVYLTRGGFVTKVMAGVYEYMPLGLRVLNKINNIIREELNATGAQELLMSVLQNKETWNASGRWESAKDVMYQFKDMTGKEYGLGFTHEEPLTVAARYFINSYKDLPKAAYQIQTKFRNEARAKSGLLRGREFLMKDLYSFHVDQADVDKYYEIVASAYDRIFKRVGLNAIRTFASGGLFSKFSDEFQVVADIGEDTIYVNESENLAVNKEVHNDEVLSELKWNKDKLVEKKSIEVGNIFKLGTRFSEALGLTFTSESGERKPVVMASYGIGPGRVMATIVEVSHDDKGIIWPENVAPFRVHLIDLGKKEISDAVYDELNSKGIEVLYDDREDKTAGEKFADADLIGCPIRLVISERTKGDIEFKNRSESESQLLSRAQLLDKLS